MIKKSMTRSLLFMAILFLGVGIISASMVYGLNTTWLEFISGAVNQEEFILYNLRLPRVLQAFFVGGALSIAGYLMQTLVNNPLADPYLLGTASGASFGANLVFLGYVPLIFLGVYMPPVFAFIVGGAVTVAVMMFSWRKGNFNTFFILLSGIAMTSFFGALISITTYLSDSDDKMRTIIYWSMGSFEKADWFSIGLIAVAVVLVLIIFTFRYKELNIYMLGELRAQSLGVNTRNFKLLVVTAVVVLVGFAVSTSGPIGFVGLVVPHFVRAIWGALGRYNIFYVFIIGAIFMVFCDLIARMIYAPIGLPVGVVSSFVGIPFFVYLLSQSKYKFSA